MDESGTQERGHRRLMAVYILISFLYWVSLYLYVPTLPTYAESRSQSLAQVGVILSQYGLWKAVVRLPLGIAADWIGRRKPFILGGILL
ncbi:MAG TPA: MFS transporter, partial [Anaerolineae bacterium]|nr:MFS transporter [Anaerolineae bacterium]